MKSALGFCGSLALITAFGAWACSSDDGTNDGPGAGTGGAATGGLGGADSGTGGTEPVDVRAPHAELFDCEPATGTAPSLDLEVFVSGLSRPVAIAPIPGTTDRYVVLELDGRVRLVENATVAGTDFLDLTGRTSRENNDWNERGLLGLAFHPEFVENGLFYVHHTASASLAAELDGVSQGDTVIAEYAIDAEDDTQADPSSMRVVFTAPQPQDNHNGGSIAFGSDGMLYIALGDGGGSNDQYGNGQNLTTPLGAILRIDVDGRGAGEYSVPAGNLRDTVASAHPALWDYGLRNPYRMSFDGCNGDLYIADVGQVAWEEINVEPRGEGGKNYGWPFMEGDRCRGDEGEPDEPEECLPSDTTPAVPLTLPAATYSRGGGAAVVGGYVYRGSAIPGLRGTYFFADHLQRRFWTMRWNGTSAQNVTEITDGLPAMNQPISAFGQDANGELFVLRLDGTIYRLVAGE